MDGADARPEFLFQKGLKFPALVPMSTETSWSSSETYARSRRRHTVISDTGISDAGISSTGISSTPRISRVEPKPLPKFRVGALVALTAAIAFTTWLLIQ